MHILIIPSWYSKNSDDIYGSFFREQAIALHKYGQNVGVIYPQVRSIRHWKSIITGPKGLMIENDMGIPTFRKHGMAWFPRVPYANSWLWVWRGLKLFSVYRKEHGQPDILHAHSLLNGGLLANEIYHRFNIPFVVTEHSTAFGSGKIKRWQKNIAVKAVHNASSRLAVSKPYAELLSKFFDTEKTWQTVPNILSSKFENACACPDKNQKETFIFCNVSILTANKGLDLLIRAFARAFTGHRDVLLLIGGDGQELKRLVALTRTLEVVNQVKFLGRLSREQVIRLMMQSDAYVLSSHVETFGVVIIEAMALGKPVIATRCGGPESIIRKEDGLLIPKNDVKALTKAMQQMRENHKKFNQKEIRLSCLERFSEKTVINQLIGIYRKILLSRSP